MASITSAKSGNWSDPTTWNGGVVPGEGDLVTIQGTHIITLDQSVIVGDDTTSTALYVFGTLQIPSNPTIDLSITLKGTMRFATSGEKLWKIGDANVPLDPSKKFTLYINYSNTPVADKHFVDSTNGTLLWYGAPKTMDTILTSDVVAGATTIDVADLTGWQIGDIITIAGNNTVAGQTEENIISAISGNTITLGTATTYSHLSGNQVCMFSSNIEVANYDNNYKSYLNINNSGNVLNYVMCNQLGVSNVNYGVKIQNKEKALLDANLFIYKCYSLYFGSTPFNNISTINTFACLNSSVMLASSNINKIKKINTISCKASNGGGFYINASGGNYIEEINSYESNCNGVAIPSGSHNNISKLNIFNTPSTYGLSASTGDLTIGEFISRNNKYDIYANQSWVLITKQAIMASLNGNIISMSSKVFINNYNNIVGMNKTIMNGVTMSTDFSTFRTSAPSINIYKSYYTPSYVLLSGAMPTFYVESGKTVVLEFYVKADFIDRGEASLSIITGSPDLGLRRDEFDIKPTTINAWEKKTINLGTTTENGLISLQVYIDKLSTADFWNLWIDDFEVVVL